MCVHVVATEMDRSIEDQLADLAGVPILTVWWRERAASSLLPRPPAQRDQTRPVLRNKRSIPRPVPAWGIVRFFLLISTQNALW